MCGTKALQWIVRYESLERLTLPSPPFIRDAVRLEICLVERQQIPAPFRFQVGDVRPQPIERIKHLAAMLERETCRLPLVPMLEAKKPTRGKQRQKHQHPQDQRTSKPPRRQAWSGE